MYSAFYVWHGVILNDFKHIQFPHTWFILFSSVAYLVISFVSYRVFETKMLSKIDSLVGRGFLSALIVGISLFAIMVVLNISFTKNATSFYLLIDFVWQIIEQFVGAFFIILGKVFIFEPDPQPEEA
ncbi:MAG: hypothetical protein ACXVP0_04155 [Bacteroidia bacterium]